MESGFYRLMQEEARQSVEAETRAKVEEETRAKIEAEMEETRAKLTAETEETRAKLAAETEETRAKLTAEMEETTTKMRQQVAHEAAVKSILTVLDARFQSVLVQGLKPAIEQIEDLQNLDQLHRTAIVAPNLEAFTETLVQNGNH